MHAVLALTVHARSNMKINMTPRHHQSTSLQQKRTRTVCPSAEKKPSAEQHLTDKSRSPQGEADSQRASLYKAGLANGNGIHHCYQQESHGQLPPKRHTLQLQVWKKSDHWPIPPKHGVP